MITEEIFQKLGQLVVGKQYTIVSFSEFGFPYAYRFKLVKIWFAPYAQHNKACWMHILPVGKRKAREITLYDIKQFIIWEGYVYPRIDMYVAQSVNDYGTGAVVTRKSLTCFDPEYMRIALYSVRTLDPVIQWFRTERLGSSKDPAAVEVL